MTLIETGSFDFVYIDLISVVVYIITIWKARALAKFIMRINEGKKKDTEDETD
jgi:hypothetical protein